MSSPHKDSRRRALFSSLHRLENRSLEKITRLAQDQSQEKKRMRSEARFVRLYRSFYSVDVPQAVSPATFDKGHHEPRLLPTSPLPGSNPDKQSEPRRAPFRGLLVLPLSTPLLSVYPKSTFHSMVLERQDLKHVVLNNLDSRVSFFLDPSDCF